MSAGPALDLRVDLGRGLVLPNPVGVASGTFGFGIELAAVVDVDRLGCIWTKGTTLLPREGNPPPRVAETAGGMLNSIGLQNPGVEHVASVYAPRFASWRVPVVVNVAGATVDEYVTCVRRLDGVPGVAGIELNISCPNIAQGLDFGREPAAAARVTAAVREATSLPVVVKLSPNVADIGAVARAVEGAGADAVSAVNTYVGMKVHLGTRRPVLPRGTGGLSGPAVKPLALAAVAAVRAAVRIPVVGIGGIASAEDVLEFFVAGADAVQVGTANFVDPSIALRILDGVVERAAALGVTRLVELRWRP
ncbi:MAG TPA: dihydroorotate dehydrogenase [Candidatus Dormibacteraeota bacterium]|nr:dihydroorotate dehydrogenase [Candidatus Dormibacteraeota bacterium]